MRNTIDAARLMPIGKRILVKPYQLPEMTEGGIILPDPYRDERSWSHFEFVSASKEALKSLGLKELHVGAILRTRLKMPADSGYDDEADGRKLLFLDAGEVEQVILWQ